MVGRGEEDRIERMVWGIFNARAAAHLKRHEPASLQELLGQDLLVPPEMLAAHAKAHVEHARERLRDGLASGGLAALQELARHVEDKAAVEHAVHEIVAELVIEAPPHHDPRDLRRRAREHEEEARRLEQAAINRGGPMALDAFYESKGRRRVAEEARKWATKIESRARPRGPRVKRESQLAREVGEDLRRSGLSAYKSERLAGRLVGCFFGIKPAALSERLRSQRQRATPRAKP